ncbi:MAG: protein kinase [Thermoanaerobaculaceae bacterium]
MIGEFLSHYRVVEQIGAGGMGVVFRAHDTHLGREVALKVLPPDVASDPERVARFEREAKALAVLDHPNIVTIFSVEEAQGRRFLTMQLVHGRTLGALIPSGGMGVEKVVRLGAEIADALSAAHERGLVHRDLKPGNVMVTDDGHAKVLDFGLAKLRPGPSQARDLTGQATEEAITGGLILGTTAYMSPEQAEGRTIDHRSDIFSLGVVLYEMLTGSKPFRGDTPVAVISSILKDTPPRVIEVKPSVPAGLDRIVARALAKDPARRYQSALDLRIDLEEQLVPSGVSSGPTAALGRAPRRWWKGALLAAAAVLAAGGGWLLWKGRVLRPGPAPASFSQVTALPGVESYPGLSPDGQWVTYSGLGPSGLDVFLQSTSGQTPINLTADSSADDDQPAFSPDGQRIAFRSSREGGGIFVMGRTGEAVRRVTRGGFNPAWSPDGAMLVYANERVGLMPLNWEGVSELWVVPVEGGEARRLGSGDGVQPHWSPHGQRIVYQTRLGTEAQMDIMTIAASGGEPTPVLSDKATDWSPTWSPDGRFIYFVSDRGGSMNLWRVPVDEASGRARGEPEPVTTPAPFVAHPSLSADGKRLAFSSVLMRQNLQMASFDPETLKVAEPRWLTTGSRQWSSPDPSPDGTQVVFYSRDLPEGDIYVIRADGTGLRQVTGDVAVDRVPRWAPDGKRIAYFSNRDGQLGVWTVGADGSDNRRVGRGGIVCWSPDGARLAGNSVLRPGVSVGGWLLDIERPGEVRDLPQPKPPLEQFVSNSWSPDGRRLAGMIGYSDEGVVVLDFGSGAYERVTSFGQWPVWLPDSRHLLFVSGGKVFFVVDTVTREVRKVYEVARDVLGPPRLTRDGRQAVFSRRTTEADIWLLTFE